MWLKIISTKENKKYKNKEKTQLNLFVLKTRKHNEKMKTNKNMF